MVKQKDRVVNLNDGLTEYQTKLSYLLDSTKLSVVLSTK